MTVPDPRKPRCLVQSKTPGRATIAEAIAVIEDTRQGIQDQVSMPAQDHLHNCYSVAAGALRRLLLVEQRCAEKGHDWRWSPFVKLMYPLLREAVCERCCLMQMPYDHEKPADAVIVSETEWARLTGRRA